MTRPCDVAVENSRSMHSEAKLTAVSKPNVDVVLSRSLSIVLGTPIDAQPGLVQAVGDRQRAVAADRDQGVDAVRARTARRSSSVRSTSIHVPSACWTG